MKIKLATLALAVLLSAILVPFTHTATQAAQTTWGCTTGTYYNSHGFSSYCIARAPVRFHRARARLYFDSGYGDIRWSHWADVGAYSNSGYYPTGKVSNGPWLETW